MRLRRASDHFIMHDPGAPPHRPHIGASPPPDDFALPSAPTANTLKLREVFLEPHSGHLALASLLMLRTSWSNFFWQD